MGPWVERRVLTVDGRMKGGMRERYITPGLCVGLEGFVVSSRLFVDESLAGIPGDLDFVLEISCCAGSPDSIATVLEPLKTLSSSETDVDLVILRRLAVRATKPAILLSAAAS